MRSTILPGETSSPWSIWSTTTDRKPSSPQSITNRILLQLPQGYDLLFGPHNRSHEPFHQAKTAQAQK
ncbi:hypothetical protein [Streptomyces sp. NPDC051776]|uniref:hypothetical protein n=1 Tax=Streptomyces sp. NPDC051776 TaxID=3155414 RepID=UPI00342473D5